ncbi:MAG TPA: ATP synthase subunit C [Candidatus Eisenbacteria bacterium]|jgi:V/A-type H+-transporting ATPase subunit K|nr:ATP synthase subunit C [Candidatus Eisenbacteria bacterium]
MVQKNNSQKTLIAVIKRRKLLFTVLGAIVIPSVAVALFSLQLVFAATTRATISQTSLPPEFLSQYGMGLLSAAIAVAGSCLGAGIAIYGAASAGAAAIAERPESSIWVLILAGLGEGVAIYGLLIAIIILSKLPAVV